MFAARICVFLVLWSSYVRGEDILVESSNETLEALTDIRIVGGQIVNNRSLFHYQASLRRVSGNSPFCGASIIDTRNLLTAAHCVVDGDGNVLAARTIQAVLGDLITSETVESTVIAPIRHIFVHEQYDPDTFQHDIAVLRIDELNFTSYVNYVPLTLSKPPINTLCVVSGWGTIFENGPPSYSLRYAVVPIINTTVCNVAYNNSILPGMMCAGYYRTDACQGDSGGPLVCNDRQVGVVSWGYGCGQVDFPGVYADITFYFRWIHVQKDRSTATTFILNRYLSIFCVIIIYISKKFKLA